MVNETRALAVRAATALGFPGARLRLLLNGFNVTWRLDAGGERYALRLTRSGPTLAHVESELAWVRALARDTALRLSEPVGCVELEGRACVLTRWVTGAQRGKGLTPNMLMAVGRAMARMHQQAEAWTPPEGWSRPVLEDVWLGSPSPLEKLPPRSAEVYAEAAARIVPLQRRLLAEQRIVLHADLHQGNYRFDPGHDVGVLDFDDCALGHPAQDIGISCYYLQRFPRCAELSAALERGYREIRGWPTDPETHAALLNGRMLGMTAAFMAHPSPAFHAYTLRLLPGWTERLERWLSPGSAGPA